MNNRYRIDWQAGMRLTDEIFRSADEFYLSCLEPLYSILVNGDYGFLSLPRFRYELTESTLSVIELDAQAISCSGKLIQLSFSRDERTLFQNINLPETTSSIILYIDKTSDKTVKITSKDKSVPLCDADYQILVKQEDEHYNNPDAVPFARLTFKHGWNLDSSFIAPCISLRANGALLHSASNYAVELDALIRSLKEAIDTDQYVLVMSVIPQLTSIVMEVKKEADKMTPRHLITLMQEGIQILLSLSEIEGGITIPEYERCTLFVESYYTPYAISDMVNEGINLTHILINITQTFGIRERVLPAQEVERERPQRRIINTDGSRDRKRHH